MNKYIYKVGHSVHMALDPYIRKAMTDYKKMKKYENSCTKKRCFIIGNGPSLTIKDLDLLQFEDCFAMNRIYQIFPRTKWRPKYYLCQDWLVLIDIKKDIDYIISECENVFLSSSIKNKLGRDYIKNEHVAFYYQNIQQTFPQKPNFSFNIGSSVYEGGTVAYSAIQLAVNMGYKEIYLLGIDHNYKFITKEDGSRDFDRNDGSNYMNGIKVESEQYIPDMDRNTLSYVKAKDVCDEKGIIIANCTRGGKLEVFKRINLDDLFKGEL